MLHSLRFLLALSAAAVSLCSAAESTLPRRLLASNSTGDQYGGFFDHNRPSECGYICRVIVIAVGGGLAVILLAALCCCCCCYRCERRRKTKAIVPEKSSTPYEYHASPAVAAAAPGPVSTSPYVAPTVATAGYGAPVGRNTTPGTYNPRKF